MTYRTLHLDTAAEYRIRVQGTLDSSWSDQLGGMAIRSSTQEGEAPMTTLSGVLIDQAVLVGVLNTLYDLHLPLLTVECLDVGPGIDSDRTDDRC
jgi:hypothetical protein